MTFIIRIIIIYALVSPALIAVAANRWELPDSAAASRDFLTIVGILLLLVYNKRKNYYIIAGILIIPISIAILFHISSSKYSLFQIMAAVRQIMSPFIIVIFASLLVSKENFLKKNGEFLIRLCIAIGLFGILERIFHIWGSTGAIREFFKDKNVAVYSSGYPFIFIEPSRIFGFNEFSGSYGVLRASSTLLDPINFGHTMVAGLVAFAYIRKRGITSLNWYENRSYPWIMLIALVLSLSKGALLQFGVLAVFFPYIIPIPYINILLIAGGFVFAARFLIIYLTSHAGFAAHLSGFNAALDSASLNGLGLGRAGNYAGMLGNSTNGITDSFFGVIFGQIGLVGGFLWLLPFMGLSMAAIKRLNFMPIVLIWTQLGVAIMSENSFNFGSIFLPIILWIGMTYGDLEPLKRKKRLRKSWTYSAYPQAIRHA